MILKTARDRHNLEGRGPGTSGRWKTGGDESVEPRNALDDRVGRRLEAGLRSPGARPGEPFDWLPRLSARKAAGWNAGWRGRRATAGFPRPWNGWRSAAAGASTVDRPEVFSRTSGLKRPGMIAHLTVPRLATRLAIGIENALAHAVVDRLLGFDRSFAESRLQLTPVEWGIWTFLILRALDGMESPDRLGSPPATDEARPFGPGDLRLDRVGPIRSTRRDWERSSRSDGACRSARCRDRCGCGSRSSWHGMDRVARLRHLGRRIHR